MSKINKVKNGISYEMNGWLYVSIKGDAKERGYAYGKLIYKEMKKVQEIIKTAPSRGEGYHKGTGWFDESDAGECWDDDY